MDIKYELAHAGMHMCTHNYQKAAFLYLHNAVISSAAQQPTVIIENCNMNQKLNLKKNVKIQKSFDYVYIQYKYTSTYQNDY